MATKLNKQPAPASELDGAVTVTVPHAIPRQRLSDLLCSAVEGGTGYWAQVSDLRRTADLDYIAVTFHEIEASGAVGSPIVKRIHIDDLAKAIPTLYAKGLGRHVETFLNENDDAETADVFVQIAMFGDLIYS